MAVAECPKKFKNAYSRTISLVLLAAADGMVSRRGPLEQNHCGYSKAIPRRRTSALGNSACPGRAKRDNMHRFCCKWPTLIL